MRLLQLRTHEQKPRPKHKVKTQQEIWESFAKPLFPHLNEHQLAELKIEAVMDWGLGIDTELSVMYDKYVMMKNLLDVKYES